MLLGPLADLRIFVWSKMLLLPLFSPFANIWAPHHLLPPPFLLQPACLSPTSLAVPLAPSGIRNLAVAPALCRLPSAQILLRGPPSTPLRKILVRWVTGAGSSGSSRDTLRLLWRAPTFASCAQATGPGSTNPSTRYRQGPSNDKGSKHGIITQPTGGRAGRRGCVAGGSAWPTG